MKSEGVNSNLSFKLNETAPILEVKNGKVEEGGRKLVKGTIVKGALKTRIIKINRNKIPFRFIQLENKKGYISPQVVDVYIGNFANLDGLAPNKDKSPVQDTSFGQKAKSKGKKAKNFIINYGLPIAGGVVGYKIAKKMGADSKKTFGYVVFFGLIGCIPRYLYRNK
jgi:hypothetical protein